MRKTPNQLAVEEEVRSNHERIEIIHRKHQIFCGLKGKDIKLLSKDPPGHTDCETFVAIPTEDPEANLIHSHEWQHIFFKTDLHLRAKFVIEYAKAVAERCKHNVDIRKLALFLHAFVNAMDDIRVASLWHRIYRGSAADIEARWRRIILMSGSYKRDVIFFAMAIGLGMQNLETSQWERYRGVFEEHVKLVKGRGFSASLVVVKKMLDCIIDTYLTSFESLIRDGQQPARSETPLGDRVNREESEVGKMIDGVVHWHDDECRQNKNLGDFQDTYQEKLVDEYRVENAKLVNQLLNSPEAEARILHQAQLEAERDLSVLLDTQKELSEQEKLLQGLEQDVEIFRIPRDMVKPTDLTVSDERTIEVLKKTFAMMQNKRKRSRTDIGSELDPMAFIDMMHGSNDPEVFIEEKSSRGFHALLLIDMSGSMHPHWETVSRACKVLALAMRAPQVKIEVWGFSSKHRVSSSARCNLVCFNDPTYGYSGREVDRHVWGGTPLNLATQVAIRHLSLKPGGVKHLIVLTDGEPTVVTRGHTSIAQAVKSMGSDIGAGSRVKVHVAGLLLGKSIPDDLATQMFRTRHAWSRVEEKEADLFKGLVELVRKAFTAYLRGV